MTSTQAPPSTPRPMPPRRSDRFFAWFDGLGLVRGDGWIAGVGGGIAARLRIDPLIVRGILVVATLFGLPMLFLYAVAWALLPDADGRIPLRSALRGRFDPALLGIAGALALSLSPTLLSLLFGTHWLWPLPLFGYLGGGSLSNGWTMLLLLGAVICLLLVATLTILIVRAARRAPGSTDLRQASAVSGEPVPVAGSGLATAEVDAGALASASTSFSGREPAEPPADASTDDLQAWRAQHAAWREQEQQWRREQQDADRVAREQARAERREHAAAFAAAAAEHRRIRRLTNPRTPAAFAAVVIGVAIVAGAMTAILGRHELTLAIGLFTAALITALGMIVAGIARRRSGFLAFVTVLLLATGATATAVPVGQALHVWGYGISNRGAAEYPASAPFVQPWGDLWFTVEDTGRNGETHIRKKDGHTQIDAQPGVEIEFDVTTHNAGLGLVLAGYENEYLWLPDDPATTAEHLPDGRVRYTGTLHRDDVPTTTHQKIVIEQESGGIQFYIWEDQQPDASADDPLVSGEGGDAGLIAPEPTPIPEGGTDVR